MKREVSFVQMGLAGASLLVWFLLPVLSFVILIPIFSISGWNLAININQLTLFVLFGGALMVLGAAMNNRKLMITAGVLEILFIVICFIFRKNVLLGGNIKWIYNSATLLVKKVPEIVGVDTSSWDIKQVVTYVVENLLQPGVGSIIHGICTLLYLIIAICAPEAKPIYSSGNKSGTTGSVSHFNTEKTHQNTGYTHRT